MNGPHPARRRTLLAAACLLALLPSIARAQAAQPPVERINLTVGRSFPIEASAPIARISVANPEIADVAVVGERDVVINARTSGETDVLIWATGLPRRHLRVAVQSAAERQQVVLQVKFAEVRKNLLRELGVSGLYRDPQGNVRAGTGIFDTDNVFQDDGSITVPGGRFLTVLTDLGTDDFLAYIEAQATRGNARILAEPSLMAANKEEARFLAGGEIPIPIAQPGQAGSPGTVTIQFREFGVRLAFTPEILNDSLIKLKVAPEVSSLDFANAVLLQGFRIPALRTRRVESTVDVRRNTSLVISGMFNDEREVAKTGIPFLMDIPILGNLFSSTQWVNNESELVVIVTPVIVDPNRPRAQDVVPVRPNPTLPAREALEEKGRLNPPGTPQTAPAPQPAPTRPPAR